MTVAKVNAEVDAGFATYDPPTRTEATDDKDAIITETNAIDAQLLVINNYVDSLETRLTAARAGDLDELAAANIPTDLINIAAALAALDPATSEEVATAIRFITSFEALLATEDDAYVGDEGREIIVDCGTDLSLA